MQFVLPGIAAAGFGLVVPGLLRDSPRHAGLSTGQESNGLIDESEPLLPSPGTPSKPRGGGSSSSAKRRVALVCEGRAAGSLWLVSAGIGCLFFVFRGLATWGVVWLVEARGLTPVQATSTYSLVEVGGVIGAMACGPLTDRCLDR